MFIFTIYFYTRNLTTAKFYWVAHKKWNIHTLSKSSNKTDLEKIGLDHISHE